MCFLWGGFFLLFWFGFLFFAGGVREEGRDFVFSPMYCLSKYPSQSQSSVN